MTQLSHKRGSGRVDYIDCAKGIGIILVIIGHTVTNDSEVIHQAIRGSIFSFHMPLFFTLSCMTYKLSADREEFVKKAEKAFRHLIIPMLITYALIIAIDIAKNYGQINWRPYIAGRVNALVYASGVRVNVAGAEIPAMGMLWFMVALFVGRTLYDYVNLRLRSYQKLAVVTLLCATGGVLISRIIWLPLSFDIVLTVLPFMLLGTYFGKVDLGKTKYIRSCVAVVIWATTLYTTWHFRHAYMELAVRRYPLFPLCIVTAVSGTITLIYISKWITSHVRSKEIVWLGRNSMIVYCIHALDANAAAIWSATDNILINTFARIVLDVVACILLVALKTCIENAVYRFNNREHSA